MARQGAWGRSVTSAGCDRGLAMQRSAPSCCPVCPPLPTPPEHSPASLSRAQADSIALLSTAAAAGTGGVGAGGAAPALARLGAPRAALRAVLRAAPGLRAAAGAARRKAAGARGDFSGLCAAVVRVCSGRPMPGAERLNPPGETLNRRRSAPTCAVFLAEPFARGWGGPAARCGAVREPCLRLAGSFRSRSPASPARFSHQIGH